MKLLRLITCGILVIALGACDTSTAPKPTALTSFAPQASVQSLWSKQIGSNADTDYLKLSPVINHKIFAAGASGNVTAINIMNGVTLWQAKLKTAITSGPAVGADLVIVGTNDATITALNSTDGKVVWRTHLPNALDGAPQIEAQHVVVNTLDGKVFALANQNGHVLWSYDHGTPALTLRTSNVPQIVGDKIITGFADGKLSAFTLTQGKLIWEQTLGAEGATQAQQLTGMIANPVIANGIIFAAPYQGKLSALSLANGSLLWQQNSSAAYIGLTLGNKVYTTDMRGILAAFDRQHGNRLWYQTQLTNRGVTAPIIMGDALVVGDTEGYLHWLAQSDGHFIARTLVGKKKIIATPPVALENTVYAVTTDGYLTAWKVG